MVTLSCSQEAADGRSTWMVEVCDSCFERQGLGTRQADRLDRRRNTSEGGNDLLGES